MLREENTYKPPIAKVISESGGVVPPDDVAKGIVAGLINYRFEMFANFDGEALGTEHGPPLARAAHPLTTHTHTGIVSFDIARFVQWVGAFRLAGALGLLPQDAGAPPSSLPAPLYNAVLASVTKYKVLPPRRTRTHTTAHTMLRDRPNSFRRRPTRSLWRSRPASVFSRASF